MSACVPERRCRRRECAYCGPIRLRDEYRKFRENIAYYGGRVLLAAVTAPGSEVLPFAPGTRTVESKYAAGWNATASARYARLYKAATQSADRLVRRMGYRGRRITRVAVVWSPQRRGVWHVHEALPAATAVELAWSRQVVRFIDQARRREERMSGRERWVLLELERRFGMITRGFYGWGFVDRNPLRSGGGVVEWAAERSAAYLAANVAGYLGENASVSAHLIGRRLRSYVSRRLTMKTGVTLENLRRVRYLYVILRDGLPWPESWDDDLRERIWLLLWTSRPNAPPAVNRG